MPRQGRAPFMMRWIVGSSLQYRFLVVGIAAAMMVFGITRLGHMPVDVFPEFAPPTAEIQTEALGLSASEVENLVTLNTEELLAGVPWLKTMRSRSVPGMSSVQLIFQPGTNLMQARQLVQERLILSYLLPNVSQRPVMLNPVSATSRTMMIGVSSKKLSPLELSVLARWTIKPRDRKSTTSELQSLAYLVCRLLLEKKKKARAIRPQHVVATDPAHVSTSPPPDSRGAS